MYIFFSLCLFVIIGIQSYGIFRDYMQKKMEFELKLEAARASSSNHINSMKYADLISILDTNMVYYVNQAILTSGIAVNKTDEQRSLEINNLLISTCSQIEMSLSKKTKEALLNYVSEDHFRTYIKDATRIMMIAKIEDNIIKTQKNKGLS